MKYLQIGRNVSAEGQQGIMKALIRLAVSEQTPDAALNQLLGTLVKYSRTKQFLPLKRTKNGTKTRCA